MVVGAEKDGDAVSSDKIGGELNGAQADISNGASERCVGVDNVFFFCDKTNLSSSRVDPVTDVVQQFVSFNKQPGPSFIAGLEYLDSFQTGSTFTGIDSSLDLASPLNNISSSFIQPSISPSIIQTESCKSLCIPTNPPQHQDSRDQRSPCHPNSNSVVSAIRKSAILKFFNSDKTVFQKDSIIFEPNQTNPVSLVLPLSTNSVSSNAKVDLSSASKPTCNSVCPLQKENGSDLNWDIAKSSREITSCEEEDRESGPPGFNSRMENSSEENSMETAIHVSEETSSSEEEMDGFSSSRARLVQEKLSIIVLGTGNADKAFAEFCRNREKEMENIRKKNRCARCDDKFEESCQKKGIPYEADSGRRKEKG